MEGVLSGMMYVVDLFFISQTIQGLGNKFQKVFI